MPSIRSSGFLNERVTFTRHDGVDVSINVRALIALSRADGQIADAVKAWAAAQLNGDRVFFHVTSRAPLNVMIRTVSAGEPDPPLDWWNV